MTPFELTVYPKLKWPRSGAEIEPYRKQWRQERKVIESKRLTDAELAAEHWSYCTGWYAAVRADDDYEGGMWSRELQRRAVILERFATLPHYDEATL